MEKLNFIHFPPVVQLSNLDNTLSWARPHTEPIVILNCLLSDSGFLSPKKYQSSAKSNDETTVLSLQSLHKINLLRLTSFKKRECDANGLVSTMILMSLQSFLQWVQMKLNHEAKFENNITSHTSSIKKISGSLAPRDLYYGWAPTAALLNSGRSVNSRQCYYRIGGCGEIVALAVWLESYPSLNPNGMFVLT